MNAWGQFGPEVHQWCNLPLKMHHAADAAIGLGHSPTEHDPIKDRDLIHSYDDIRNNTIATLQRLLEHPIMELLS